jgi:hypothetical protein
MRLRERVLITIALGALSAAALWVDRSIQFFIGRDSSLFLYVAQRIQDGGLPYRDVWDHKPPLIYYFGVIGLALGDHGITGVTIVEFATMLFAAVVGFWALYRTLGLLPALFGSVAWITAVPLILDGGNRPEEYAWPFQFSAIALFVWDKRAGPSRWRWFVIGIAAAFAGLLKPTILGVWAAIYLAETVHAWQLRSPRSIVVPLTLGALGVLAVVVPIGLYFVATGVASDFVDQVLRFNVEYSSATLSEHVQALLEGIAFTSFSGLFPIAFAGWVAALVQIVRGTVPTRVRKLLLFGVFALPIDYALASATGRPYREYFLGCLPTLGVLAAIAASSVRAALERAAARLRLRPQAIVIGAFVLVAVLSASAIPALAEFRRGLGPNDQERTRPLATTYVVEHTASTDRVLFWGGEGGLNFTTGRRAPTRYAYQYALYMRNYQSRAKVDELLTALQRDPPALIVDASPATLDVPPLDRATREGWTLLEPKYAILPDMDRLFSWIDAHYVRVDEVGYLHWPIYAPREVVTTE